MAMGLTLVLTMAVMDLPYTLLLLLHCCLMLLMAASISRCCSTHSSMSSL
jgi:hypothetical protein